MSELSDRTLEKLVFGAAFFLTGVGLIGAHSSMPKQYIAPHTGPERKQDIPPKEIAYDDKSRERLEFHIRRLSGNPDSQFTYRGPNPQFLKRQRHADSYQY